MIERLENISTSDGSVYLRCTACDTRWRDSWETVHHLGDNPPCPKCNPHLRDEQRQPTGIARVVDVKDIAPENSTSVEIRAILRKLEESGYSDSIAPVLVLGRAADEIDRLHAENCLLKRQTTEKMRQVIEASGLGDKLRRAAEEAR